MLFWFSYLTVRWEISKRFNLLGRASRQFGRSRNRDRIIKITVQTGSSALSDRPEVVRCTANVYLCISVQCASLFHFHYTHPQVLHENCFSCFFNWNWSPKCKNSSSIFLHLVRTLTNLKNKNRVFVWIKVCIVISDRHFGLRVIRNRKTGRVFLVAAARLSSMFLFIRLKTLAMKKNFILFVHLFFNPRIINSNPSTGRLQIHNYFYLSDIVSPRLFMALNSFIAFRSLDTELTTFFELKFYCNTIDCPEKKKNESSCFVHHLFYPRSWKNIRNTRVNHLFVTVSHSSINITVDFQSEFFINKLIFSNQIRLSKKSSRKKIMIKRKICKISWKERIHFENRYSSHKTLGEFQ